MCQLHSTAASTVAPGPSSQSHASSTVIAGPTIGVTSKQKSDFFPPFNVDALPQDGSKRQDGSKSSEWNESLLLPATWRSSTDDIRIPEGECSLFLTKDLCLARLNAIHDWLWVVGRPMPPRPLTAQLVHRRDIIVTEDMNLHLVWSKGCMFLKPLPRYLLDPTFWKKHLTPPGKPFVTLCPKSQNKSPHTERDEEFGRNILKNLSACEKELASSAAGFLFSWTALIAHESDWRIAHDKGLIPSDLLWYQWKSFVRDFLDPAIRPPSAIYEAINRRFHYGELRLGRLNKIYRFSRHHVRGYLFGYTLKSDFFEENFTRLASVLGYIVIVLTAMQVGLGTDRLTHSQLFQDASYAFTVFSIITPLFGVVVVLVVFLYTMLWNVEKTKNYEKKRFEIMRLKTSEEKKQEGWKRWPGSFRTKKERKNPDP